jgi:hypothetical protein
MQRHMLNNTLDEIGPIDFERPTPHHNVRTSAEVWRGLVFGDQEM